MRYLSQKKTGFSLIELIVSITIIGLLAAVVLGSLGTARKKGRVAKRVADMKQVQAALEFYYSSNHAYPSTGGAWQASIPGLAPTYIPVIPTDPQSSGVCVMGSDSCYLYRSDGNDWAFIDSNASEMFSTQSLPNYTSYPELVDPVRGSGVGGAWKVSSPGGTNW